jgi:hypothetical protein
MPERLNKQPCNGSAGINVQVPSEHMHFKSSFSEMGTGEK